MRTSPDEEGARRSGKRKFDGKGCAFMKQQLRGIALILIGIQLAVYAVIDPWILILGGDVGRVLIPLASVAVSAAGLVLCFRSGDSR